MAKRFYKVNEMVWLTEEKVKAKVVSLDIPNLKVRVTIKQEDGSLIETTKSFMQIDKLRTKTQAKINVSGNITSKLVTTPKPDTVLFAKFRDNAIIPSKNHEDAGFDLYASLEGRETEEGVVFEKLLKKGEANLVPTGIGCSLLPKYYLNCKHERGSTGKHGMAVLSGVVDSGYRGEIFVNIVPMFKDVLITSTVSDVEDLGHVILYPYSKAIAQATVDLVPHLQVKEITLEQLKAIPSVRGEGKLGQSGK